MIAVLGGVNLAVVFGSELASMAAFSVWGAQAVSPVAGRWALAIAAPAVAAVIWGLFCAPEARVPLPGAAVLAVKLVILAAACGALILARQPWWAAALATVAIGSGLLTAVLPNPWAA